MIWKEEKKVKVWMQKLDHFKRLISTIEDHELKYKIMNVKRIKISQN